MSNTVAASAYFLTCCRPIHNSFCFLVENPKFINFNHYPLEYFLKHPSGCRYNHENLFDHNLNHFNVCTDDRAWSLDGHQRRQHFNDLICGRTPHCDPNEGRKVEKEKPVKKPKAQAPKQQPVTTEDKKKDDLKSDTSVLGLHPPEEKPPVSSVKSVPEVVDVSSEEKLPPIKQDPSVPSVGSEKLGLAPSVQDVSEPKDVAGLTDELIEKLDRNLRNLESTFDKFVKKNRDFIQNLVECLDFEKQKQKALEDDYNKLKQENEELKTQNDYLKMVNNKQLDLFKNELDKGINENKVIYKRKIHLMERQLQNDQSEIQMYKQTEKKYMEVVEQDNEKIEKLNNKIEDLKNKEVQLVRNYLQLLKFLENVKNILSNADPKEIPQLKSLNTVSYSEGENNPDVKRVLRNALSNGISTLNVRDLSILHDAIEGLNDSLCHQTDKCTKSPTADSSFLDFSSMSIQRVMISLSHDDIPKQSQGYGTSSDQSIDRIPTRQKPEDRRVKFS